MQDFDEEKEEQRDDLEEEKREDSAEDEETYQRPNMPDIFAKER